MIYGRKLVPGLRGPFQSLALAAALIAPIGCVKTEGTKSGDSTVASSTQNANTSTCAGDNSGITLPPGFCATVFADTIGHVRHIVVAPNGDVYVNTWSGPYYTGPTHLGGFLVALRDTNNDGKADIIKRFGPDAQKKNGGGTGIGLYKGALYAEEGDTTAKRIVRYAIPSDSMTPTSATSETIVSGLPFNGDHPMHPFVIDATGNIYMDVGTATNACQLKNRVLESPGHKPCTELRTRGGIWRYDANKTNQKFSPAERYVTGIRNAVGIAFDPGGQLYSTQHGRDQLFDNWPKLYTADQGQNLPAEELLKIEQGGDYGWPTCYFDGQQPKLVLAPEYGGDGGKGRRRLRDEEGTRGVLPRALGARRPGLLFRLAVPRPLQGRRFHRLPRLVEPRARAAAGIQRRVRSLQRGKAGRSGQVRDLCRWLRRGPSGLMPMTRRRTVRPALRRDPTAPSTSPTTRADESGRSSTRVRESSNAGRNSRARLSSR